MFAFSLAALLGKTVKQLLAEMDSREFSEWQAYDRLAPIDHPRRAEVSAGTIAAAVSAPYCKTTPKGSDFYRDHAAEYKAAMQEQPAELTPEQAAAKLESKLDAIMGAMGRSHGPQRT